MSEIKLNDYDLIIVNSSGGKDSLCALYEIHKMASKCGFPMSKVHVSHQDLGKMEWERTKELAKQQADLFGANFVVTKRRNKNGESESLLEYARRRGKWPSRNQRWCTSDLKRGPGERVVTQLTKGMKQSKVLYVFGFRAEESPFRKKKEVLTIHKKLTNKSRLVHEYLPIHDWTTEKVWQVIRSNNLPYHFAYDLGMPRLSCVFCIFSPFDALVIAGKNNPELLDEYIKVEKEINHTFRNEFSIASVKKAIEEGYNPTNIKNWTM